MARPVVLLAATDPSVGHGGAERYVRTQARALLQCGYEPHLFGLSRVSEEIELDYGCVHRVGVKLSPLRETMVPVHTRVAARAVEAFLLRHEPPYLLHSFGAWSYVGAIVAKQLRARRLQTISLATSFDTLAHSAAAKFAGVTRSHGVAQWLSHGGEFAWSRLLSGRFEGAGYRAADRVIVNYDSVRRLLQREFGLGPTIRKLPYASETAFEHSSENDAPVPEALAQLQPQDAPLLVCVSRHSPRKGVDVLLRALARLRDDGVGFRACLVGRGPLLQRHQRLATDLQLGAAVAITGYVADSFPYIRHADVFVLPSLEEGSGSMSLIEALQAGVAVVASNVDGIPEDVAHEESALLVAPGDAEALAVALRRAATDASLRQRLASRGLKIFDERFRPEGFAEALRATYEELGFR